MVKRVRKPSERTARRAHERALVRASEDRERLFGLERGGHAERPLEVPSAAVIEAHATSVPCPRCGGGHAVVEHSAIVHDGVRLRRARMRCRQCGRERSRWFKIVASSLN